MEHTPTNEQVDELIKKVQADPTKTPEKVANMVEHYELLRPGNNTPEKKPVDVAGSIKRWSNQRNGLPAPAGENANSGMESSIIKWSKSRNK